MNTGYGVAILGILGLIVGIGMYAASWHKTIGLGGVGLGIILLIVGIWYSRQPMKTTAAQPAKPAEQPKTGA